MKFSNSKIKIEISEEELKQIIEKHLLLNYDKNVTISTLEHKTHRWTEGHGMCEMDYSRPNGLLIIAEEKDND